jgi:uncharacterized coiled-coil protein SlyX
MSDQHDNGQRAPGVQERVATLEERLTSLELSTAPERMKAAAERLEALATEAREMMDKARERLDAMDRARPAAIAAIDSTAALKEVLNLLRPILPNDVGALHRLLHPDHG